MTRELARVKESVICPVSAKDFLGDEDSSMTVGS